MIKQSTRGVALLAVLFFFGCGSLDNSDLSGGSAQVNLVIQNPDPNAHGTAKAVFSSEVSKAASSSSSHR